ncbi:MAG: hypothetical protein MJ082_01850, partial [Clostridia bacterium]|nr:hypothetical protein [Clostridia bacterium]
MAGNLYLERLILPSEETEGLYIQGESKCKLVGVYSSYYPFRFFSSKFSKIPEFRMDRITVFFGGNGSGKSTLLNVIAEKLGLSRKSYFNSTDFFEDYCSFCKVKFTPPVGESKIITSDDVFKKMSDVRRANEENDRKRAFLTDEKARKKAEAIGDQHIV